MTGAVTPTYRVRFEDRPTSTVPVTPDLMAVFRHAERRASGARPARLTDVEVTRLVEWLESDSLDWDAVARVRDDGW
jgi:hypothetical protein